MFTLRWLAILLALLVFAEIPASAQHAEPSKKAPLSPARQKRLAVLLQLEQDIETKLFIEKLALKRVLEDLFADKFKLPVVVDTRAFAQTPLESDLFEDEVSLMPIPPLMPMGKALDLLLAQVAGGRATYLVLPGYIEIVPTEPRLWLRRTVSASYQKRPLRDVLDDLSDSTGVSINLDLRTGDKGNTPITATFTNVTLQDVLTTVTESAALRFVLLQSSVLVTTAERARTLQTELDDAKPGSPTTRPKK